MDKLGFVKTFEVALAALLLISLYTSIQAGIFSQSEEVKRSLNKPLREFINYLDVSGELRPVIENHDFLRLDSLFNKLFLINVKHGFEVLYSIPLIIDSETIIDSNLSFIYHFPSGVDEKSIKVIKEDYELPVNALFNWYSSAVVFNEQVKDCYVNLNFSLPLTADNKTLKFYINNAETIIDLEDWSVSDVINASITVYVPEVNQGGRGYLYFSNDESSFNNSFQTLTPTIAPSVTVLDYQKADSAEILMSASLLQGTNNFQVQYTLFSEQERAYDSITNVSSQGLTITPYNNEIKDYSTKPISSPSAKGSVVEWLMPLENGLVMLRVYGDYI